METLILQRIAQSDVGTIGALLRNFIPICFTLEPAKPAIPPGLYDCIPHNGDEWKDVWEITKVPGHTEILIHAGNTIKNTLGCVLVGQAAANAGVTIVNSDATLNALRKALPPEFQLNVKGLT